MDDNVCVSYYPLEWECDRKCRERYGNDIPEEIQSRLDIELAIIREHSIAKDFLKAYDRSGNKCHRYLGETGSFVAYLLGLSDVEPLPPYYRCHRCGKYDFNVSGLQDFHPGDIWMDLPDHTCPECGTRMSKGGSDIPYEAVFGSYYTHSLSFETIHPSSEELMIYELAGDLMDPNYKAFSEEHSDDVMSLFSGVAALGIEPEQIGGVSVGTLGTGDEDVRYLFAAARPKRFSDVVRLYGIARSNRGIGSNTEYISDRKGSLYECIAYREDIMTYLMSKGIDRKDASYVMEIVRPGQVASGFRSIPDNVMDQMQKSGVSQCYIEDLSEIEFLDRKAYACYSAMIARKLLVFKLYRPVRFYRQWFEINGYQFKETELRKGYDHIKHKYDAMMSINRADMNCDLIRDMNACLVAMEMFARGIKYDDLLVRNQADGVF